MATETVDNIPPPPPGFTRDVPPPPAGFTINGNGAATGNPNLAAQGRKALRPDVQGENPLAAIGGATGVGAAMGGAAPELLSVGANVVRPIFPAVGAGLDFASQAARTAGRVPSAIAGAISGAGSETAGQVAEGMGANGVESEVARFVGGGLSAETANFAKEVLKKYAVVPALGIVSKFKHEAANKLLSWIDGTPQKFSEQQKQYVNGLLGEIRGGPKADDSLEEVGSIMGKRGQELMTDAEQKYMDAVQNHGRLQYKNTTDPSDLGTTLRDKINTNMTAQIEARRAQYKNTEKLRDDIVKKREAAGDHIEDMPEYKDMLRSLEAKLLNTKEARSAANGIAPETEQGVLSGYQRVYDAVTGRKVFSGLDTNGTPTYDTFKTSFQALDSVRRKLGEVFKGAPSEGYEALNDARGRELYAKITELQKAYAGGDKGPHAKLLDDYHSASDELAQFRGKFGRKATALDRYQEGKYTTDAADLPKQFFKTRESFQALRELTGDPAQANAAAMQYADKELSGKSAAQVREWQGKNKGWLDEVHNVNSLVDKYATRLEGSERSLANAQDFAKQAVADNKMLVGKKLPAQRAVDLIKSGNTELWDQVTPAIAASPQAKDQMVSAVRQVVADAGKSADTINLFSRSIRPFLEKSGIATTAEMDGIAQRLAAIQTKQMPESMKLGMAKRLVLNSFGGYTAGGASRAALGGYGLMQDMIPQ